MKKNRKKTERKSYKFIVYLLVFVLGIGTVFYFIFRKPSTTPGIEYIQNLEAKEIDNVAKKVHKKRVDELMNAVETGKIDTFSMFDDFVFYGDSRTLGWQTYGYLPAARIFAGSGHTILNINEWEETLKELKPSTIYFSYGVNDMGLGLSIIFLLIVVIASLNCSICLGVVINPLHIKQFAVPRILHSGLRQ